jgi:hypothetical protein
MLNVSYRTTLPMMVLAFRDNHQAAVTIPAGELIQVAGRDRDERFRVVCVHGEEFLVFETDLEDRGYFIGEDGERYAAAAVR